MPPKVEPIVHAVGGGNSGNCYHLLVLTLGALLPHCYHLCGNSTVFLHVDIIVAFFFVYLNCDE